MFIQTPTFTDAVTTKKAILDNWNAFADAYKGTGAKYITLERLKQMFSHTETLNKITCNLHDFKVQSNLNNCEYHSF